MMKSLYSGVAGMKVHNQRMDVIGNNISNVNTTGYKASEVTFKDIYYQTKRNSSSGTSTKGGKNPTQIGYGAQLSSVTQVMSQSGYTFSDSVYNVALEGEGFFQVMDDNGNIFYTRAGKFSVDSYGNLTDPSGHVVLGVSGDPTGVEQGMSQRINIHVPAVDNNRASSSKTVNGFDITISAADYGEQGNISFTIVDSDTSYATKTGDSLTIYLDLDHDFGRNALVTYAKAATGAAASITDITDSDEYKKYMPDDDAGRNALQRLYGTTTPGTAAGGTVTYDYDQNEQYWIDFNNAIDALINKAMKDGANSDFASTISNARNLYTEAAMDDFKSSLNNAIVQGGVGLDEGVIPLDVAFDSMPAYSDVQALKSTNMITLYKTDSYGNIIRDTNGDPVARTALTFTADTPGEFANKYEIDLKQSNDVTEPTAKWKDNVLTIIMPPTIGSSATENAIQKIQKAIDDAANGEDKKKITVSMGTYTTQEARTDATGAAVLDDAGNPIMDTVTHTYDVADLATFDFTTSLHENTERLGLDGGRNNFFSDLATALSTVSLTDGRLAAEQTVADLETVQIDSDGIIYGRHAVHGMIMLGRIDVATFENPMGLEQVGTSLWRASLASGEAQVKIPGEGGSGGVVQNALEMSNVDLAQEFSDMIITQRGYQANSRVITVSDTMLEELVNLKR